MIILRKLYSENDKKEKKDTSTKKAIIGGSAAGIGAGAGTFLANRRQYKKEVKKADNKRINKILNVFRVDTPKDVERTLNAGRVANERFNKELSKSRKKFIKKNKILIPAAAIGTGLATYGAIKSLNNKKK